MDDGSFPEELTWSADPSIRFSATIFTPVPLVKPFPSIFNIVPVLSPFIASILNKFEAPALSWSSGISPTSSKTFPEAISFASTLNTLPPSTFVDEKDTTPLDDAPSDSTFKRNPFFPKFFPP